MNKTFFLKTLFILFCLNLLSLDAWAQDDEFNMGDQPTNTAPKDDLNLPEDLTPSTSTPAVPTSPEPTLEASPAPEVKPPPTEIAIPRELPQKNAPQATSPTVIGDTSDPDLRTEEDFHKIYKKYNEQPTNIEQWEKIIGNRASESYVIQKNDTLWDLSKTLFAEPNYWPKIWSLNKDNVFNPHQINPKLNLRFYPGTKSQPPTLGVTEKPIPEKVDEPPLISKADAESADMKAPDDSVLATPKSRVRIPVLRHLPPSFPEYSVVGIDKPKLIVDLKPKLLPSPLVTLPYYISDKDLNEVGVIKETEIGSSAAFEFQYVFIQVDNPSQKIYTVIKENSRISLGLLSSASYFEVQGEVELMNKVEDSSNLYRAIVRKALQRVEVGAKLVVGPMQKVDVSEGTEKQAAASKIIGGQFGSSTLMFAANTFVFLDQGAAQGYKEGDILPVYATYRNRNEKSNANINERRIGSVKIVNVGDSVSTGYILKTLEDVQKGDIVGALPSGGSSPEVSTVTGDEELSIDEAPAKTEEPEPTLDDVPPTENLEEAEDEIRL